MYKEQSSNNATREQARQILKNGICDMSVVRLIQMSRYGLMGNIVLSNEMVSVENVFNCISYNEDDNVITFSVEELQGSYGSVSFLVDSVTEITGCEDEKNPEEYLNVNIKLKDGLNISVKILY
jgi:hypothetical protein